MKDQKKKDRSVGCRAEGEVVIDDGEKTELFNACIYFQPQK